MPILKESNWFGLHFQFIAFYISVLNRCKVRSLAAHAPALQSLLDLSCPECQSLDSFCAERSDPLGSQDLTLAFHRPFFLSLLD